LDPETCLTKENYFFLLSLHITITI